MAGKLVIVRLDGGPSNGEDIAYTVPPPLPAHINYSGLIYDRTSRTEKEPNTGDTVRIYSFDKQATDAAAKGLAGVGHAWTRLMRALGHGAPRNLRRIHTSTANVRRMTRNHH